MTTFPPASEQEWLTRIAKVLKGEDFEKKLVSEIDGIRIDPLYGRIAAPSAGRARVAPWKILQRVDHPKAERANELAAEDVAGGADGLVLVGKEEGAGQNIGLAPADVGRALQGIALHQTELRVDGGEALGKALAAHVASQPVDPARLKISFDCDDAAAAKALHGQGFQGPFMTADGRMFHGEGETDAAELGASLAWLLQSLRKLDFLSDTELPRAVSVTLAASQDMFLTLAKFRAMHLLWARLLETCHLPITPLALHGETSRIMMAAKDPHSNLLRAVAATFAAGLGGTESFTVLPLSAAQGLPNSFARRMARNTQIILQQESSLWRAHDPGSGAGYIEHLTQALCERGWDIFRSCEKGDWPASEAQNLRVWPVIGVTSYQLAEEPAAEVESAS
ncbi:MAG: methylmalonyl-CoA mutase family protein [Proteobacteria bacterium]|nr:methylmalonyl-CoA mutase family protein [Pseudomonadota bacterium]